MICGISIEVSAFVFGGVLFVEFLEPFVSLVGSFLLSEVLALLSLELVPEDADLFESDLFLELSDFELPDFEFFAFCLESFFVFFAFCLESESLVFESLVFESFVCFAEVF
jgi:hypothetical protein